MTRDGDRADLIGATWERLALTTIIKRSPPPPALLLQKMQMRVRAGLFVRWDMTLTLTFLDRPDIRGVKRNQTRETGDGRRESISQSKINLHAVLANKPRGTTEPECCTMLSRVWRDKKKTFVCLKGTVRLFWLLELDGKIDTTLNAC